MPEGLAVAGAASPWQTSVSTVASNFHALTVRSMKTFISLSNCWLQCRALGGGEEGRGGGGGVIGS